MAKYSDNTIFEIQNDLLYSNKSYKDISEQYKISLEYLTLINRGVARKNDALSYPLRVNGNERKQSSLVTDVMNDLMYTGMSIESIAKKHCISSETIYDINNNHHRFCPQDISYPIRDIHSRYSTALLNILVEELRSGNMVFEDIQRKYHISHTLLSRINQGKRYRIDGIDYPIRPSSARVYNPVETIPG